VPSTFTTNTGIEKIADGEQSGLWGQTTNRNFDIIDRALNGSTAITLSGTTHTLTTSNGALSDGQFGVLSFGGSPSGPNTVTIAPNTAQKFYWVRNNTAQNVILSQGSGSTVTLIPGATKAIYTTGGGTGASVVDLTATFFGNVTGNLTGNVTGNLTGNVTGDVSGNAGTATALQTARTIGGVSFNGTANINLPGVNQTGNQNTTGSAASLTTPRTINGVSFNGTADITLPTVNITGNQTIDGAKTFNASVNIGGATAGDKNLFLQNNTRSVYFYLQASGGDAGLWDQTSNAGRWVTDTSGNFTATGNVTAFSDLRLKTDLVEIQDALSKVAKLTGYTYTRADTGERQTGVVAQDVQQVLPEAVIESGDTLAVAYGNMVGLLVEAIKELTARVEALEAR
jgi:hypothetical protein